jgi:hypothetical protein
MARFSARMLPVALSAPPTFSLPLPFLKGLSWHSIEPRSAAGDDCSVHLAGPLCSFERCCSDQHTGVLDPFPTPDQEEIYDEVEGYGEPGRTPLSGGAWRLS